MLRRKIETQESFEVIGDWDIPEMNIGDKIIIVDKFVIRGTEFLSLKEKSEEIPMYEFKYALRNGLIK